MKKFWLMGMIAVFALIWVTPIMAISFQASDIRIGDGTSSDSQGDFWLLNNGSGSVYAAWLDYRNSGDYNNCNVYFNYSSDYGKTWQASDIQLSTFTSYELSMACTGSNVYVSWTENHYPATYEDVLFRYSHDNGANWSTEANIPHDTANYQKKCQLSAPSGSTLYAFWKDFNNGYGLNFQRSTNGGVSWGATFTIDSNYKDYPALHADSSGHVYCGYADNNYSEGLFMVRPSSDYGANFGTTQRVDSAYADGWTGYYHLGSYGANVYALWNNQTQDYNIRFNRSTNYGQSWGASGTVLNTDTTGWKGHPQMAYDQSGNAYVAWVQSGVSGSNNVHVNVSNDSGGNWLGSDISLTNYTSSDVQIAASTGDQVVAAYEDSTWATGSSVLKARYSQDGGQNWDSEVYATSQTSTTASQNLVAASADNYYFYAMWRQYDTGSGGVAMYLNYAELIPGPTPVPPSGVTPGDYSGDGTAQIGIYRSTTGLWAITGEANTYFGSGTDEAVPRDYNGDGAWDVGVFKPAQSLWAIKGVTRAYFGSSADILIPGDYNGDGTADVGVFKESQNLWAIRNVTKVYFGNSTTDYLVPGDYNGNGALDIAIFRPSTGLWSIRGVGNSYFGATGDMPIQGDYNGDGTWEAGVFKSSQNLWAVKGVTRVYFGATGDERVQTDYNGDGAWDVSIFRPATGLWAINGVGNSYFGTTGDTQVSSIPVPNP